MSPASRVRQVGGGGCVGGRQGDGRAVFRPCCCPCVGRPGSWGPRCGWQRGARGPWQREVHSDRGSQRPRTSWGAVTMTLSKNL